MFREDLGDFKSTSSYYICDNWITWSFTPRLLIAELQYQRKDHSTYSLSKHLRVVTVRGMMTWLDPSFSYSSKGCCKQKDLFNRKDLCHNHDVKDMKDLIAKSRNRGGI